MQHASAAGGCDFLSFMGYISMNVLTVTVLKKTLEAEDIYSFELVSDSDKPLPPFSAGSHIDVQIAPDLVRQYSLCNSPAENHRYVIGVLKDPRSRGGSTALHEMINEGDTLTISAPKNHFQLNHDAQRSLMFAGGIGVTPILCMAERLAMVGADFEMHYCTRSPARTAFKQRIVSSSFASRVHFHVDDGAAEQKLNLARALENPVAGTDLYVCGPKAYMDAVLNMAREKGWPEQQLHYEFFSADPVKLDSDTSFEVKLASSGKTVRVVKDQSVVQALASIGVEIPVSCEQGVCGTCITRVISGEPDHRDMYLTSREKCLNDQFMPCCSRSKSPVLVLDL
jgi:vanillate O-demethylase ferredoxin subunit